MYEMDFWPENFQFSVQFFKQFIFKDKPSLSTAAPITPRLPSFPAQPGTNSPYLSNPFGSAPPGHGHMNSSFPGTQPEMMQQYLYQQQLLNATPPIPGQVRNLK